MSKVYAGIGSRAAPKKAQQLIATVAHKLRLDGWVLRSGHAEGADLTFEDAAGAASEIYLPWPSYNSKYPSTGLVFGSPTMQAHAIARCHYAAWRHSSRGTKLMMARNIHIILGRDCQTPVDEVVCWTPNSARGGTGFGIHVAKLFDIPIRNLEREL